MQNSVSSVVSWSKKLNPGCLALVGPMKGI